MTPLPVKPVTAWAAMWQSKNKAAVVKRHLIVYQFGFVKMFNTRKAARNWIEKTYGYIRHRPDLLSDPHGWRVPIAVRVQISVK